MRLKQVVKRETCIGLIINLILGTAIPWFTTARDAVIPLVGGPDSAGFGLFPPSFFFPFGVTLILSKVIQKKVNSGAITLNSPPDKVSQLLPKSILLRALSLGIFFSLVFASITLLLVKIVLGSEWIFSEIIILNAVYSIALSLLVMPIVIRSAAYSASNSTYKTTND